VGRLYVAGVWQRRITFHVQVEEQILASDLRAQKLLTIIARATRLLEALVRILSALLTAPASDEICDNIMGMCVNVAISSCNPHSSSVGCYDRLICWCDRMICMRVQSRLQELVSWKVEKF
jgi:hypothetical protein